MYWVKKANCWTAKRRDTADGHWSYKRFRPSVDEPDAVKEARAAAVAWINEVVESSCSSTQTSDDSLDAAAAAAGA